MLDTVASSLNPWQSTAWTAMVRPVALGWRWSDEGFGMYPDILGLIRMSPDNRILHISI